MIEMDQAVLASVANISRNTVVEFERGRRTPGASYIAAIKRALEHAGVMFIEDGEVIGGGPGVRLRPKSNGHSELIEEAEDNE